VGVSRWEAGEWAFIILMLMWKTVKNSILENIYLINLKINKLW